MHVGKISKIQQVRIVRIFCLMLRWNTLDHSRSL